jgi:hypothetical protein
MYVLPQADHALPADLRIMDGAGRQVQAIPCAEFEPAGRRQVGIEELVE